MTKHEIKHLPALGHTDDPRAVGVGLRRCCRLVGGIEQLPEGDAAVVVTTGPAPVAGVVVSGLSCGGGSPRTPPPLLGEKPASET